MVQGRYHPVMQCKLVGAFDKDNNLTGLHMRLSGQSILASVRPQVVEQDKGRDALTFQGVFQSGEHAFGYSVPNLLIDHSMRNPHVPPGFWRGVNINQNCIFIECFMDELAAAAGQDPLAFRRKLMDKHPRNLAVLNAVAERIGWDKPAPQGIYRGLAHMKAFNAYVAASGGSLRHRRQDQGPPHRRGDRCDLRRQSGADRSAGRGIIRLRPVCPVLAGVHGQGRPHRRDQLRHLRFHADRPDAEGRDDHRCRAAAAARGAASANRPSAWRRRR